MRRALALAALLALAGCTGLPTGGTATETPYADTSTTLPAGPKDVPDRPTTLNASTAGEYARTFEYRYVYNTLWRHDGSTVEVDCDTERVESARDGYRVTVTCYGYANTQDESDGNTTATVVHADWGTQTFDYYVDSDTTRRLDHRGTASPSQ